MHRYIHFLSLSTLLFAQSAQARYESIVSILDKTLPSVVSLTVLPMDNNSRNSALGSGFVWDRHGHIVTNAHVINTNGKIIVSFQNNQDCFASVNGIDDQSDIAVLQVDKDCPVTPIKVGSSNNLRIGQNVTAIGNPHDLGQSITKGIISALHRNDLFESQHSDSIQIDAIINPGNSGGPLINANGEVIGINNALFFDRELGHTGIGFAIPISTAKPIINQLITKGRVTRGYIGIETQEMSKTLAKYMHFRDTGMIVARVVPNSPADQAGIIPNDIIMKINNTPILSVNQIPIIISSYPPKTQIELTLWRNGKLTVHQATSTSENEIMDLADKALDHSYPFTGVILFEINTKSSNTENLKGIGVLDISPNSNAFLEGLRLHDIITHINDKPVTHLFSRATFENLEGEFIKVTINRNGHTRFLAMRRTYNE